MSLTEYQQVTALVKAVEQIFDRRADAVKEELDECPWILDWIVQNLHDSGFEIARSK